MMKTLKNRPADLLLSKGFTLIELMIAVAIVGVLAAISIPAFNDYLQRSKVSEVVSAVNACKTSVTEYILSNAAFPANATRAGCTNTSTSYMNNLQVNGTNGFIRGQFQNIHPDLDNSWLELRPSSTAPGYTALASGETNILSWQCGSNMGNNAPGRRFLPANCRPN